MPAGMTEADLGFKSIPRNPLLFGMLYRMDAVEHVGSGIKRIHNLCREHGAPEPRIEISEHWVTVVFPRPAQESRIGTGHGRSEHSVTSYTDFERASSTPDEVIAIHYDSRENLLAMGVIPAPRTVPDPFPAAAGFVPDPPRR